MESAELAKSTASRGSLWMASKQQGPRVTTSSGQPIFPGLVSVCNSELRLLNEKKEIKIKRHCRTTRSDFFERFFLLLLSYIHILLSAFNAHTTGTMSHPTKQCPDNTANNIINKEKSRSSHEEVDVIKISIGRYGLFNVQYISVNIF